MGTSRLADGLSGLLNLGVRAAVTRYVAQFYAESKDKEASAVASSALAIFLIVGIIAILASLIMAFLVAPIFHIPLVFQFAARMVLLLAGFNIATALVRTREEAQGVCGPGGAAVLMFFTITRAGLPIATE
jgi:O-antigen/teichoic acid export membrane protein